jgi:hypothetical protein
MGPAVIKIQPLLSQGLFSLAVMGGFVAHRSQRNILGSYG